MKISARNVFQGKVKQVKAGAVNAEVIMKTDNGTEIVSIITKESAENLKLAKGKKVSAVIKASSVMIMTD
jgi:molybdate transport system regulatory protein